MTTDSSNAAQAAEDAVSALYQSFTDEAMTAAADALVRAIQACADADALEGLLAQPQVGGLFSQGMGSLSLWPPVVDAMVSLAEALTHAGDAARVLGWARWACSTSPVEIVRPDVVPSLVPPHREAALPAFEARAPLYRRWLGDAAAERRAAGAHALAWCRSATPADANLVRAGANGETDGAALGSALLTLGVLVYRLGADADAARALAQDKLGHGDPFARACAAAALALMKETLSTEATSALTEVVAHRGSLPAGWGWRTPAKVAYETDALACAVLNWAPTSAAEDAVRVLASVGPPHNPAGDALLAGLLAHLGPDAARDFARTKPQQSGPGEPLLAGALAHLAFAARGHTPPAYGLVASELDATQRAAVEAMGRRASQAAKALRRVGLYADPHQDIVTDFLEGKKAEWRPIDVEVDGQLRRWHFGPLWGATIFGQVSVPAARDAILAAMTPAEAVDLVTRFTDGRMPAYEQIKDDKAWERDQELALAVIDAAVARGFDLDEMMRAVAANNRSGLPAIAAVAYLRAHPDHVPAEFQQIIEDGAAQTQVPEPLHSLVAKLRAGGNNP
ncbi:MAG: hypothetical protein QM820_46950 [Minicystis sp.]